MDWKTIVISLLVVAVVISAFMEWLKILAKKKRKRLPTWLQISTPFTLSVLLSWIVWSALELPGAVQIIVLYSLIIFLGQYYLSMEILKRVGKPIARFFMRSKGMSTDEIKEALGE